MRTYRKVKKYIFSVYKQTNKLLHCYRWNINWYNGTILKLATAIVKKKKKNTNYAAQLLLYTERLCLGG